MGVNFIFNFTGFDWLKERGYRPSCHHNCRPAEKAEATADPPPGSATQLLCSLVIILDKSKIVVFHSVVCNFDFAWIFPHR